MPAQVPFGAETLRVWCGFIGIHGTPRGFTLSEDGKLISVDVKQATEARKAVWMTMNPVKEGTPDKKPAITDMAIIRNVTLDFEKPECPPIAHSVAVTLCEHLCEAGFIRADHPIEDSGAGAHIIIPVEDIIMEEGTQKLWNEAVSRFVEKYLKPLFVKACNIHNVVPKGNMTLGAYNIDRIMSPVATWRPPNPKKDDCDELKQGVFRKWLTNHGPENPPIRRASAKARALIVEEFVNGPEAAKTHSNGHTTITETQFGDYQEYIRWLDDYYQKKQTGDRSSDFHTLVWGCYAKFGETVTRLLAEEVDRITGQKYGERAGEELERSLQKAIEQVDRDERQVKASSMPPNPSVTDEQLCFFTADDAGNADAMYALYGENFHWCSTIGWLYWCGTHWYIDVDDSVVRKKAVETLRKRRHAAVNQENESVIKCTKGDIGRIRGCLEVFKSLVAKSINEFDNEPDYLNCKNGVVALRTGLLQPHDRNQLFTYCVKVPYEQADYTEWTDFLKGVVGGGQEMLDYFQMAIGYSLSGRTSEECFFYAYGPTRSGKGTCAETLMSIVPEPIFTMVDFNSFTAKREGDVSNFDLASLKPSRLVFASESNKSQTLNPAKIKLMTGGDKVTCCFKHKDFFSYRPQYKIWMLSNHQLNGDPEDDALWGRARVISFPNSYLGKEDKAKKMRMKDMDVQTSVLYWAVQGAIKWYATGSKGLHIPQMVQDVTMRHRADLDYIQQWIDTCGELDGSAWTSNEDMQESYMTWCKANSVYPKKPRDLALSLKQKGCTVGDSALKKINGKMTRGVKGLKLGSGGTSVQDDAFSIDF